MSVDTLALFVNPAAGRGRADRRLPQIRQIFEESGLSVWVAKSSNVGDLEAGIRAAALDGNSHIVVAGGDGSIHEAVNGIVGSGKDVQLGIVPTGTGNDFAKACNIPLDWRLATRQLASRVMAGIPSRRIDIGRMNDRCFANGAGIGFDAKITRIARSYRWPKGDMVYLLAILHGMIDGIATPELRIRSDNYTWLGPVTLANVSNGPWIGGMFHIAPMAVNDDGELDLLIAGPVSRRRICRLIPKLIHGRHVDQPEITHARLKQLRVVASSPVPSHLDGEVQEPQSEFDIEILPAALGLL